MVRYHIHHIVRIVICLLLFLPIIASAQSWEWEELPPLPEELIGFTDYDFNEEGKIDVLVKSKFREELPNGWSRDTYIYELSPEAEAWVKSDIAIWGSEQARITRPWWNSNLILEISASRLQWIGGRIVVRSAFAAANGMLPYLTGATLIGDTAYLAGKREDEKIFLDIDLSLFAEELNASQENIDTLTEVYPGPPLGFPVLASRNKEVYLFGGEVGDEGNFTSSKAAYRFTHDGGWESIAPMPYPLRRDARGMAQGPNHITVFGGVGEDGAYLVQSYHVITDTWIVDASATMPPTGASMVMDGHPIVFSSALDRGDDGRLRVFRGTYVSAKNRLGWLDYTALVLYFAVLVGMGYYFSHRENSTEAFFLGNRRIPWWAVGISIFGTSLSAITYISIPATAYATNWVTLLNNMGIVMLAPFVAIWYMPRLREHPVTTAYEYLEQRFNLGTRIYGSIVFIVFQIGRMSIVLYLPAIALSAATGMDIQFCILTMGLLATLYTVMGGIEAVIWTDVIQSVVLVSGAILALVLIVFNTDGGVSGLLTQAYEADKMHMVNWSGDYTTAALWVVILGGVFANAYPAMADQTVVQRYLSTASEKEATKALWTNALLTIPIQFLFFSIGTALWLYYRQHPAQLDPLLQNDAILPLFVIQQFPAGLKGVLIAGLFAASMSSLDSSMNSLSSVLVNDYYRRFVRNVTERNALRAAKGLTLLFGMFGTVSALYVTTFDAPLLFELFLKFLGLVGGGLAGIFVLGTFTKRANGVGALAGAVVSALVMFYVRQSDIHFFIHGMIGFLTSLVVGYVVSLASGGNPAAKAVS